MAVKTYVKSQRVQLSKNFNSWEFRCGIGRGCNCTTILIDDKLVEYLQKIRDHFGVEVTITSAYRDPDYNRSIGGATGSYHTRGMAADIVVKGVAPRTVAAYCESIGILGIGLYETAADGYFVHIDTRTYKSFWFGQAQSPRTTFGGTVTQPQNPAPDTSSNSGNTYTVQSGDTLAKIAAKYSGVTYQQIAALNGLKAPYVIHVGQKLSIPTQGSTATPAAPAPSGEYASADYSDSPDELYWFLLDKIGNAFGVCGLLANLNAESNLVAACLEITARNKLGYTSKAYTDAVDSGKYLRFATDYAGYGLAQWTDATRKTALLAYAKKKNASIGNRKMQVEFLMDELAGRFSGVLNILKTATSVRQASNAVLMRFECPADQGQAVQDRRAGFGESYYNRFKDAAKPSGQSTDSVPYFCTVTADVLNVRNGPGTSNSILRRISTGTACTIVEEKDGWGRLSNGGWVSLQYVKK